MSTGVWALGLNHRSAPLDLRGRFAFPAGRLAQALVSLRDQLHSPEIEAALLSTCNRTELYLAAGHAQAQGLLDTAQRWLAQQGGTACQALRAHCYTAHDDAAARHAFRVASGLDSMVLGEPQILGQLKQAVREAGLAGTLGSTLHQLFQRSFAVAKEVRSATAIGSHSVSMAAACVRLAQQLFERLEGTHVLLVGAGEMIELVASHVASRKPRSITVANRSEERSQALAARFGAATMPLAELPSRLHRFDIVISCTASTLPLIGLGAVERALRARKRRPVFMVDLAVPRDIEPQVAGLADVYLYTVDDLASLVQSGAESRQAAVAQAEAIVDAGVEGFARWRQLREQVPLIRAVQAQTDEWRAAELAKARRMLAHGEPVDAVLEALARGLSGKLLHGPLAGLRSENGERRGEAAEVVQRWFLRGGEPESRRRPMAGP